MAIPENRTEFKNRCFRKLGAPVIQINVANEQAEDRIDDALNKFYERHNHAVEEMYILYEITDVDEALGYLQLEDSIIGVVDVFRPISAAGLSSVEYQSFVNNIYGTVMNAGGLSYYYMNRQQISLLNRYFNPDYSYSFNPINNRLRVAGGVKNANRTWGGLIVRCFKKLNGDDTIADSNTEFHNIWKNKWLQDYAAALIQKQWGENLSKYQTVSLVGGVQMNGDGIYQRAVEEIAKLEEQLMNEHEYPATGFYA